MSTLAEKLKAKKEQQSGVWHPEEGDILEGRVTEIGNTITANGDAKYAHIETEQGKVTVFLNSVLQKQFEQEKVDIGDTIGIEFLGKVKSRKGKNKEYFNYLVAKADTDESAG